MTVRNLCLLITFVFNIGDPKYGGIKVIGLDRKQDTRKVPCTRARCSRIPSVRGACVPLTIYREFRREQTKVLTIASRISFSVRVNA